MKWVGFALALGLLLGIPGCKEEPLCETIPGALHRPAGLLLVGQSEEVALFAGVSRGGECDLTEDPLVSSVSVELLGPGQQPVAHEASLLPPGTPEPPSGSLPPSRGATASSSRSIR
jgi:hypothetical protein